MSSRAAALAALRHDRIAALAEAKNICPRRLLRHKLGRGVSGRGCRMSTRRGFFSLRATWAIPILVVVTLGLGLSGWLSHGYGLNEAAYRAVSLFDLGNGYY